MMTVGAISQAQPPAIAAQEIDSRYGPQVGLCYQCKRCTSGCPLADVMDFRPHQMVRLARLGATERLLTSEAIWTCVGCYLCTARCPQGVPVAELVYALKGFALRRGLTPKKAPLPAFLRAFEGTVERYGRNHELTMLRRYFLSTDPMVALRKGPMGLKLFRQGRLPLRGEKVRGRRKVRAMLRRARRLGESTS